MTSYYNIMKEIEEGKMKVIDNTKKDMVNSPPHYNASGIECIDAIEAALTEEEFRGYLKGNIIKYVWRERMKGGMTSMRKAGWYIDRFFSLEG